MRFRSLFIDYKAEALQVLKEEREERNRRNPQKRQRVIRILSDPDKESIVDQKTTSRTPFGTTGTDSESQELPFWLAHQTVGVNDAIANTVVILPSKATDKEIETDNNSAMKVDPMVENSDGNDSDVSTAMCPITVTISLYSFRLHICFFAV